MQKYFVPKFIREAVLRKVREDPGISDETDFVVVEYLGRSYSVYPKTGVVKPFCPEAI